MVMQLRLQNRLSFKGLSTNVCRKSPALGVNRQFHEFAVARRLGAYLNQSRLNNEFLNNQGCETFPPFQAGNKSTKPIVADDLVLWEGRIEREVATDKTLPETMRKTKHRGITKVTTDFMLNLIAYNLIRIPKLLTA
jgi:hypothetical protein